MSGKIAYVFDFDNTYLRTDLLIPRLDELCHTRFPQISDGLFKDIYRHYKNDHNGSVNIPEILDTLGFFMNLPMDLRNELRSIYKQMDLRESGFLMNPDHSLIRKLGMEHVYFLSMGDDAYQSWKIDAALPEDFDRTHIDIRGEKNTDIFRETVKFHLANGYDRIIFVNDRLDQLKESHLAGNGENVQCIFMHYGKYADRNPSDSTFPYDEVHDFSELEDLLMPKTHTETMRSYPSGERK